MNLEKEKICVVVAHLDDEIIFFNSVLKYNPKVKICFLDSKDRYTSMQRKKLIEADVFENCECLAFKQPNAYMKSSMLQPQLNTTGLRLYWNQDVYNKAFDILILRLRSLLKEFSIVFTHNPWGEYGHEEHVLVYRAVKVLQQELGFKLMVNGYVSNRSFELFNLTKHELNPKQSLFSVDHDLAYYYKKKYIEYSCWTWDKDYNWPEHDIMYEVYMKKNSKNVLNIPFYLHLLPKNYRESFLKSFLKSKIIFMLKLTDLLRNPFQFLR